VGVSRMRDSAKYDAERLVPGFFEAEWHRDLTAAPCWCDTSRRISADCQRARYGLLLTFAMRRFLGSQLHSIGALDPFVVSSSIAVLARCGFAGFIPARRDASIAPLDGSGRISLQTGESAKRISFRPAGHRTQRWAELCWT
jgi:hypothetical protein